MGKGARNKRNALATPKEVSETGAGPSQQVDANIGPSQQVDANIGTLTNKFTDLLGVVKNMSMQLDEISSGMKGLSNNGKKIDAYGKSTPAVSDKFVDSELDIVGEFHSLKQTDTVAEYQEKFEELRNLMVAMNYGLTEDYFISSFLSGLKQEIKHSFRNSKPETLYHAFNLARIKEISIELMKEKLISSDMEEQTEPRESVLVFVDNDNPLKFGGLVGERAMTVIISTGIGYSFIDTSIAIHAGCKIEETEPLLVTFVMGGYQAVSRFICPRFQWTMQGHKFVADMRIVELKACDMILGGDWVGDNSPLTFSRDGIFLQKEGKEIVLLDRRGSAKSETNQRV